MTLTAEVIVVFSSARAAVLFTDLARLSLISFASVPMRWASTRMGTTKATTTTTTTMATV